MATEVFGEWKIRIAYDANGDPEYIGEALPGADTSNAVWRIKKITYVSGNPTQVDWASSTKEFDKVWDNYASYAYG